MGPFNDFTRDVRYALRQLARAPGFAVAAILCLALGIGVATIILSVANVVMLRPLPLAEPDRLVIVSETLPPRRPGGQIMTMRGIPHGDLLVWRRGTTSLSDGAGLLMGGQVMARTPRGMAGLWGGATTPNTFTMLGVRPILGRVYDEADGADSPIVLLTYRTWVRHFNADPHVVGTTLELQPDADQGGQGPLLRTIIGVLPADFGVPTASDADYYLPFRPSGSMTAGLRMTMIGRLVPGASIAAATDELNTLAAATRQPWPTGVPPLTGRRIEVRPLKEFIVATAKPTLGVVLVAVIIVWLIACANVANLLLARGTARHRELTVRHAIGASRGRLVRQILTECLILAAAGGAGGALLAAAGVGLATQLATVDAPGIFRQMFGSTILPRAAEVHVDFVVVAIAFALAALTTLLFGLLPAWQLSRSRTLTLVGPGIQGGGPTTSTTRSVLVVSQLALATVLLVAAGLLVNSFARLMTNGKGYDASDVVALQAMFPTEYPVARKAETVAALLQRLRQLPGVRAAGFARHGLLIGEVITLGRFETDATRTDPQRPRTRAVSDGFLTAMGVPLIDGRDLRLADDAGAPPVVVLNRSAAMRLFGTTRAVGQPVNWFVADVPVELQVVGVFEDVRQESLADEPAPEVFVDYRQLLNILSVRPDMAPQANVLAMGFPSFAIRTEGAPVAAIPAIQRLVSTVDPNLAIDAIVPMTALVADSIARERFAAVLLGVLAMAAAMLASIGVYGVLTYLVARRTSEIGLRMALGAQRGQVLALVLRTGMVLTSIGLTLGLIGAATMTQLLRSMLFGITPLDPLTFVAVAVLFGMVTVAASYVPARRAAGIDPLVALRHE